jgi:type I site-specific restriction-modification system R (restriction) subunit
MSEEMVMRTADSPAAATGDMSVGSALIDHVRQAATDDNQEWALNDAESDSTTDTDSDNGYDEEWSAALDLYSAEEEVRQRLLDNLGRTEPEAVPYERFREVNEQAKVGREVQSKYDQWADVIQQFEENGFNSAEDVRKALESQQEQQHEQQIREKWAAAQAEEYLDPALADAQAEAEIQKYRYEKLNQQVNGVLMQQQRNAALTEFPYARRAMQMVDNLMNAGMSPREAASHVHDQIEGLIESMVPELAELVARQKRAPTPISTDNSAQPVVRQTEPVRQSSSGIFSRMLGIR